MIKNTIKDFNYDNKSYEDYVNNKNNKNINKINRRRWKLYLKRYLITRKLYVQERNKSLVLTKKY